MPTEFKEFTVDRFLEFLLLALRAFCVKPPLRIAYLRQDTDAAIFVTGYGEGLPMSGDRVNVPERMLKTDRPEFLRTSIHGFGFDVWVAVVTDNVSPDGDPIKEIGLIAIGSHSPKKNHIFTQHFPLNMIRHWFSDSLSSKRMLEHFKRQANTDKLTGLPNLRETTDLLLKCVREALDNDDSVTVVIVDLDFFKAINDTFGHQAGDDILKNFADHARAHGFTMGRIGGEEFLIILPNKLDDHRVSLRQLRQSWAGKTFLDGALRSTFSGGACELSPKTLPAILAWSERTKSVPLHEPSMIALRQRVAQQIPLQEDDYHLIASLVKQWADACLYLAKKEKGRNIISDEVE